MSRRMPYPSRALGLLAIACAAAGAGADEAARSAARPRARVYTNADLERVHPFAAETGASSVPALPSDEDPAGVREPMSRGQSEAYWRREAATVRERLRTLDERAAALRARIAERKRAPREETVYGRRGRSASGSGSASGSVASLRSSLAALERRMQRTQEDLEDRARREGAMPGWLR